MKRIGTALLSFIVLASFVVNAEAQVRNVVTPHRATNTATSTAITSGSLINLNEPTVFLPGLKGATPQATSLEADSNYTDTTEDGNGWYLWDEFGDTTEALSVNNGGTIEDTTATLYSKAMGERFTTGLTAASIDSVQFTFVPVSFSANDSLIVHVVTIWDQTTIQGDQTLPFINFYGQQANGVVSAALTLARDTIFPSELNIGEGMLQTVTATFGKPGTGKALGKRTTYAVTIDDVGPDIVNDTFQYQMEADVDDIQDPLEIDTDADRTYFFQLTADDGLESQGWAVDAAQLDQNGDQTGEAYFGNMIMIAYLHGTSAGVEEASSSANSLYQNYPNPISSTTEINYQLASSGPVQLKIYNDVGEEVESLVNGVQGAGQQTATFDASKLPNGMYFYRLQAGDFVDTKSMVVSK